MIIDLHIHTYFSACSLIEIPQLIRKARELGLDGICITDHDTIASKFVIEHCVDKAGISVIVGMEYTTTQGDFLVFGPVEQIPQNLEASGLYQWLKKEGGIAIPAHPFRKVRGTDISVLRSSSIIEGLNGRNLPSENEICQNWLKDLGRGVKVIGGSDAHTLNEVGTITTVFKNNIYSSEDLIRELSYGSFSLQESPLQMITPCYTQLQKS